MTSLDKAVVRKTRAPFFNYGPDRNRHFVAALCPGDLLLLRPVRSRVGGAAEIQMRLVDIYRYALQCRELSKRLEKARVGEGEEGRGPHRAGAATRVEETALTSFARDLAGITSLKRDQRRSGKGRPSLCGM